MKKRILITIIGIIIIGIGYFGPKMFDFPKGIKEDIEKSGTGFEKKTSTKQTEFTNGRWISTTDSLAGIEIKNGKWILFYKGIKTNVSDIYDFEIRQYYFKALGAEPKPIEYLTLTNQADTLEYSIIEYDNDLLSLRYMPRGNTLNYKPEK